MQLRFLFGVCMTLLMCWPISLWAQEEEETAPTVIDSTYREDQFYLGVTYNLLYDRPSGVQLQGLSGGIQFGYMRDMPLNEQRNLAVAIGAGIAFDQYGSNLFVGERPDNTSIFRVLDDNDVTFNTNRLSTATVEAPLEFRWRSSTATEYKFWRVYAGVRVGYVYWYKATFKQPGNTVNQTDISEFDRLRLGATLSFGYSTFNFHAYYGINPFFENATTESGQPVDMKTLKLGIMFYIL